MFSFLNRLFETKSECDHIFYGEKDSFGRLIGQKCIICEKFNDVEKVIPNYMEMMHTMAIIEDRQRNLAS